MSGGKTVVNGGVDKTIAVAGGAIGSGTIDSCGAKFVLHDGKLLPVLFGQDTVQQGGLSASQESRQDGDWDTRVGA